MDYNELLARCGSEIKSHLLGGAFAVGLVVAVVLMILVEYFAPALFYQLTAGL